MFSFVFSSQAASYTSPWHWTKVTATGEWHSADGRKESTQHLLTDLSMGHNDFHSLQQLFNTGNIMMTANQKSSCNKNQTPNVSSPNGNLNMNTVNNATNNNNNNGKSPYSFPFLSPSNQTATNPLSPINLPSMAGNNNNTNNNINNNASILTSSSISNQSHGGFSSDHTATTTNNNPSESRNNISNANQMMNQSISGTHNPLQRQQQQQQQLNSMLSQSRHLPFPYNLNNFHRNY